MHVLALDTTTLEGSVALVDEHGVVDERRGDIARSHAERLPGDLAQLVEAHGVSLREMDLFAVASGPGSFTGLRIGIATIQGLALASGRRKPKRITSLPESPIDRAPMIRFPGRNASPT